MTLPAGTDAARLRALLDELGDEVERLLLGGMTTASAATRDKLDVVFREASRQGLLRLAGTLSHVSREIGRYVAQDAQFSARRLSLFIGRTWLLARSMARALQAGDATAFDHLAMNRPGERVDTLRAVTLGVSKKVVPGSFCAFEFRMRRLEDERLGAPLVFAEMFPSKSGQDLPAEAFLVLERPQRYKPRIVLDGGVVTFRDVMLLRSEAGLRVTLGKDSRVEAGEPFDGWSSLPAWDPAAALARVRAHTVGPLELPNDLHEEVVLPDWQLGEPSTHEQRHTHPVQAMGLALDGLVADGVEGQALRDNLERMRAGKAPVGLGPGHAPAHAHGKGKAKGKATPGRLFGLLHYETCRFVLQPLALITERGPIHLMTSIEGIDHKALLRNLVRR
jgi:hypothetical protein